MIPVRSLQRFAGKAVSFSLAVPAAKLFCREVNFYIGKSLKNSRPVRMTESLKIELEHWRFLDTWDGFFAMAKRKTLLYSHRICPSAGQTR